MPDADADYVTNDAWLRVVSRADAIDDVADQFERRTPLAAAAASPPAATTAFGPAHGWPQRSRGWRSLARFHPRSAEQQSA